jgi:hypothetical protein
MNIYLALHKALAHLILMAFLGSIKITVLILWMRELRLSEMI